jgi:transcription elongation factor SPT5
VESSDNNVVNIYPFIEELCDKKFEFPIKDLCKFFDIGDHVKVIEGRYIGITGMVVSCKDNTVDFIADINRTITTVLANDLKLSEEISSGQDRSENYNINEIILLKNDLNFGIVTKINSGGGNNSP